MVRFWSKIEIRGPDECWEWQSPLRPDGYGQFSLGGGPKLSHRVAYELSIGEITEGAFVCHTCDNKPCCNPAHLFIGTAQDNSSDMRNKGRGHGRFKLAEESVLSIIEDGRSQIQIAKDHGVSQSHVSRIKSGKECRYDYLHEHWLDRSVSSGR